MVLIGTIFILCIFQRLIQGGIKSTMMIVPDCDHFNVAENIANPDYTLTQVCIMPSYHRFNIYNIH